jgi:exosortase/archaeosortase family protein
MPVGGRVQALGHGLAELQKNPGTVIALLTFVAVCVDSALVPKLNTVAPMVSCGLFLLLMLRRRSRGSESGQIRSGIAAVPVAAWRILLFLVIHLAVVTASLTLSGLWRGSHSAGPSLFLSASKYLILLPTAVLLPAASWLDFSRAHHAEWIAAAIALTFYPYRIFAMAWPWYAQALGHTVYALAHAFVSSIQYVPTFNPTLVGTNLDITIVFGCSGLQGIRLFQILFGLVVVVDWNALNRRRAAAAYFGGLLVMLFANVIRIALLFILGNTGLKNRVIEYHLTAGWLLFTLAFIAYLLVVYRWLLKPGKSTVAGCSRAPATEQHRMFRSQE